MIVQFTGAQSTGKTSVSEALERLGFCAMRETARAVKELGFKIDHHADSYAQSFINNILMNKYLEAVLDNSKVWVFDRSFICCYAYGKVAGVDEALLNATKEQVKLTSFAPMPVLTFYFPPLIDFVEDGVRSADSREEVDMHIADCLHDLNVPFFEVPAGTVQERVEFIVDNILSYIQGHY